MPAAAGHRSPRVTGRGGGGPQRPPRQGPGVLAAAAVGLDYADELVVQGARDVHEAVRRRVHRAVDAGTAGASRPAGAVHAGIARTAYGGVGLAARGAAQALRFADTRGWGPDLDRARAGRFVNAAVHGLVGDRLETEHPELVLRMALRHHARDLAAEAEEIARCCPDPTGDVVVFVHGWCEHEEHWGRAQAPEPASPQAEAAGPVSFGSRLRSDLGYSPVLVRANTGLSVTENGAALSSLLDRLLACWPVPVRRLVLVGHSMGGLILHTALAVPVRAATRTGEDRVRPPAPWQERVSDVVTLGAPHHGARMARGADRLGRLLGHLPETAPVGRILDTRSRGVRDLERGLPRPEDAGRPGVRYRLVAATLGPTPRHPSSLALGDLLVDHDSALARSGGRELFPGASTLHVGEADHFALLHDERVYRALHDWLAQPPS